MIQLREVSTAYQSGDRWVRVLDNVTCAFEKGAVTLVIGQTGSGKSTLLHALAGLLPLEAGSIFFDGRPLWTDANRIDPSLRFMTEMAFQHPERQLFADSVSKELAYSLRPLRLTKAEAAERASKALTHMELSAAILEESPFSLSDGFKRKAAILTALAPQSEWLLLDEPTAGIDPGGIVPLRKTIGSYRQKGAGIIIASHDLDTFLPLADQVIVLHHGTIEAVETPKALCANPNLLMKAGIGLPSNIQIAYALQVHGISLGEIPMQVQDMADEIADSLRRTDSKARHMYTIPSATAGAPITEQWHSPEMERRDEGPGGSVETTSNVNTSVVYRLQPFSKWLVYMMVSTGILLQDEWLGVGMAALIVWGFAALAKVSIAHIVLRAKPFLLFIAFSGIISGLQPEFASNSLRLTSVGFSLEASFRTLQPLNELFLMLLLGMLFARVTNQRLLLRALEHAFSFLNSIKIPVGIISFAASLILRFLPMLFKELERLSFIIRARGKVHVAQGKIRMRDVPVLFIPFILNMMKNAEDLAMALEARGYRLQTAPVRFKGKLTLDPRDWQAIAVGAVLLCLFFLVDAVF